MPTLLVLHGPNLNLLGTREPEVYGSETLDDINGRITEMVESTGGQVDIQQRNGEHELIELIHAARGVSDFIIINPGAFTHTSIAIRDALLSVEIPFIEVHLSNVYSRESFRQHSYLSDVAVGCLSGLGYRGYLYAASYALETLARQEAD